MKLLGPALVMLTGVAGAQTLPADPGPFAPSFTRVTGGRIAGAELARTDDCARCHADVAATWRSSAHAHASFSNPIYRLAALRLAEERGRPAGRFCGGCHDPALLVDGALDAEVAPLDPRAHAGVTCRVCHSVVHTTSDGNGSYTLTAEEIPLPARGDARSHTAHVARAAPAPLRTPELCASCHKVFLDEGSGNAHHLAGQDDASPYFRSAYAGSRAARVDEGVAPRTCQQCHMPRVPATLGDAAAKDGTIASHRFAAGHTWLAAMTADGPQLAQARELLARAATLDVIVDGDRADVVMFNAGAGHQLPGGTLDAQDSWLEVEARDAAGRLLGAAGADQERTGSDPTAHRLRALLVDDAGAPLLERETHRFRAVVWNHTLAPRDAAVVRIALPAGTATVIARLRHRTHGLELQRAACAEARGERGRRFAEGARQAGKEIDPCAPQPVTELARAVWHAGDRPGWEAQARHGLGLLRALQERLEDARPALVAALAAAPDAAARARVLDLLALLEGKSGRPDAALAAADRAEAEIGAHPALARARGEALALVWRWPDAARHLATAAAGAPLDDVGWRELAQALGSAGRAGDALEAAGHGLALQPRDPDLLLSQALGLGGAAAQRALDAYLVRRVADESPGLRNRCQKNVPGCLLERNPVHTHELKP